MMTKRNLFTGGVIAFLTAGILFTVGQKTLRKQQADTSLNSDTPTARLGQASRPGAPAEIIGRTGYPLYR